MRGHKARAVKEKATEKRGQSFATFVQDALKVAAVAVAVAVRCESSRQAESLQNLHYPPPSLPPLSLDAKGSAFVRS